MSHRPTFLDELLEASKLSLRRVREVISRVVSPVDRRLPTGRRNVVQLVEFCRSVHELHVRGLSIHWNTKMTAKH